MVTKQTQATQKTSVPAEKKTQTTEEYTRVAIVRVRGKTGISHDLIMALDLLNLKHQNHCVVLTKTPTVAGMIKKVQGYVTFGPISDETLALLNEKRKQTKANVFALQPPRKGFGRKGVKVSFQAKGALGNRRDKMDDLIQRML